MNEVKITKVEITEEAKKEMVAAHLAGLADKAYDAYQLEWMKQHGYSLDDLIGEMQMINERYLDEYGDSLDTDDQYKELCESGFSGEIWAGKDEFIQSEFQDEDWMKACLDGDDFKEWKWGMDFLKGEEK